MRILLTCEDYFPDIGGAEVCVHNLQKELTLLGHTVTIFTNTIQKTQDEDDIVRLGWKFSPIQIIRHVKVLWTLIQSHDIVHCQYSFRLSAISGVLAHFLRKPMLLTQQGKGIVPEAHSKFFNSLLIKVCQHVSMRTASHITSTSDEISLLTAAFVARSKITLISNGYDIDRFQSDVNIATPIEFNRYPQNIRRILSIRRLVPKNGIHIFIQALSLIRLKYTNFHYFVIGEGRSELFIRRLIKELDLEGHVSLLGKRENEKLVAYYKHADLIVIPSSAEARSIACIEAMGMGKPIIASRVGGLIDLLGEDSRYGQLVRIYESESCNYAPPDHLSPDLLGPLVQAVLDFLQNPELLQEKGRLAHQLVRHQYSWASIAQQYLRIYESLISSTRKSRT